MDIERLKELKDYLRVANELSILNDDNLMQRIVDNNDVTNTIDIAIELLNAEIARQSEVEMAVCPDCGGSGVYQEYDEYDRMSTFRCPACDGAGENMTNYDRIIRDMTVEQMAKLLIEPLEEADSGMVFYHTSTGGSYDYDDAIQAEIEWLKKECDA